LPVFDRLERWKHWQGLRAFASGTLDGLTQPDPRLV
jgi:hypothetical protein